MSGHQTLLSSHEAQAPKLRFPEFRHVGKWEESTLERLFQFKQGVQVPVEEQTNIKKSGMVRFIRIVDLTQEGEAWRYIQSPGVEHIVKPNELFMIRYGTPGLIAMGHEGVIANNLFRLIWKNEGNFNSKFWFYIFKGLEGYIFNLSCSSSMPAISFSLLKKIAVAFPTSLLEQQKIADCLSSVDELITAQTQKIETLKTHKKGLMQQLFPCEGETVPRLRFPEFRDAGEWEKKTVGEIGSIVTGNTPSTTMREYYGGDRLFVSPADMADHRFIYHTKTTLTELGYSKTRQIPADSVLFVCIGSTIGKIAQNKLDCATNQQINAVVLSENYSSGFIYYSLDLNASNIAELAGKQAVPIINKTVFSTVVLDLPSLKEQQQISECLSSLDELISLQSKSLDTLKIHKKGLMQQLFPVADKVSA